MKSIHQYSLQRSRGMSYTHMSIVYRYKTNYSYTFGKNRADFPVQIMRSSWIYCTLVLVFRKSILILCLIVKRMWDIKYQGNHSLIIDLFIEDISEST